MPDNNTQNAQMQAPQTQTQQPDQGAETEKQLVSFLKEMEQKIEELTQRVDELENKSTTTKTKESGGPQQGLMAGILNQVMGQKLIGKLEAQNPPPRQI